MLRRAEAASGTIMLVFRLSRYTGSNVKLLPKAMMLQFLGAGVGAAFAESLRLAGSMGVVPILPPDWCWGMGDVSLVSIGTTPKVCLGAE